jgi:hypothetical protein
MLGGMAKPPRRPREIKLSAEVSQALTSRVQVPRRDWRRCASGRQAARDGD